MTTNTISKEVEEKVALTIAEYSGLQSLVIKTDADYVHAGETLKRIALAEKEVEAERVKITKPMDESKKAVMDFFRKPLEMLGHARQVIGQGILAFNQEKERQRKIAQDKIDADARAQAEKDKAKLLKKAETQEKHGNTETAEAIREQAEQVQPNSVKVVTNTPKVNGVGTRKLWRAEVVDFAKLADEWKVANQKALDAYAVATKGERAVPGVVFKQVDSLSVRG